MRLIGPEHRPVVRILPQPLNDDLAGWACQRWRLL